MKTDDRPLHLVAMPGDKRSICGIKDPLPVCWTKYGPVHSRHRPPCPTCFEGTHIDGSVAGQDNPPHSGGSAHSEWEVRADG